MAFVVFPFFFLYVGFLETEIHVDEEGLDLKSPLKTFHVKWEDVIEIRRRHYLDCQWGISRILLLQGVSCPCFIIFLELFMDVLFNRHFIFLHQ